MTSDMNTDFKKLHDSVFGKAMENVSKHREIKLVTTENRRNYLVSEQNYYTTKFLTENILSIEMKKLKYSRINCIFGAVSTRTE